MNHRLRSTSRFGRQFWEHTSQKMVIVTLATLICGIAVFGVRAYNNRSAPVPSDVKAPSPRIASQLLPSGSQTDSTPVEAEVITIRPTGFQPQKIARPQGPFLLAVENRSGLRTIDLILEGPGGKRLYTAGIPIAKHDLARKFDLVPGAYVLREANHPEWHCIITIEKK